MTLLRLNPRKIEYYTPYSRQVLPKRRKAVRMNFQLSGEEDSQWKMYINMEDYKNKMVPPWNVVGQNGIMKGY
jgi:hypothetical protein